MTERVARTPSPTPRPDANEAPGAPLQDRFRRVSSQNKLVPRFLFTEDADADDAKAKALAALHNVEVAMRTMCNVCDETLFDTAWSEEFETIRDYLK